VKRDVKLARTREYDTAREAALDGPNVPVEVYDTLVETVRANLDTLHRHAELKADALGVEELAMWDLYTPMADSDSPEVSYEEATDHVQPYILMNWQDDIASMFTLAHELGHSLHSEFASEHQPYVYADYEIFVAEVASTVNETLLTHHLLDTVEDERFRRHVLDQYLERFRSTLYRQTMFAEFEHRIHAAEEAGEALTPDRLDSMYRELKAEFYEPAAIDDHIEREWMRIPHFYYNYYVYQYATGISSAVAIARRIFEEGEPAVADYLDALKLGGSAYPLDILDTAGVDVRDSAYVEAAIDEYGDVLEDMAALMD
ncbi:MAG: M3 family metallopeptidase, partial [Halobacteriaceae archaeon]